MISCLLVPVSSIFGLTTGDGETIVPNQHRVTEVQSSGDEGTDEGNEAFCGNVSFCFGKGRDFYPA